MNLNLKYLQGFAGFAGFTVYRDMYRELYNPDVFKTWSSSDVDPSPISGVLYSVLPESAMPGRSGRP